MSLLEALVAAAILGTGLLSLAQALGTATIATASAGRMTRAALAASQKIEELRASADAPIEAGGDAPAPGVTRQWQVVPLSSDPAHLALVHVVVRTAGSETRMTAVAPRSAP